MSTVTSADFDRTLDDLLGERQMANVRFVDKLEDGSEDVYVIRMQRTMGQLAGRIDCVPKMNGENAWQVERSQWASQTVGDLLLLIASAPAKSVAAEFFGAEPE